MGRQAAEAGQALGQFPFLSPHQVKMEERTEE